MFVCSWQTLFSIISYESRTEFYLFLFYLTTAKFSRARRRRVQRIHLLFKSFPLSCKGETCRRKEGVHSRVPRTDFSIFRKLVHEDSVSITFPFSFYTFFVIFYFSSFFLARNFLIIWCLFKIVQYVIVRFVNSLGCS